MKKLSVIILLVYLAIGFVVFYSPKDGPRTSIEMWSGAKSDLIKDEENGTEEELQNLFTVTKEQRRDATPKLKPTLTKVPDAVREGELTPEITGQINSALDVIATIPTGMPTNLPVFEATTKPEPTKSVEKIKENHGTVTYKEKEIRYSNTTYRMDEELLSRVMTLICDEPYNSSFVLYDINSEAMICYNENNYYPVASTVKAPFVLTCLQQIDAGEYSLEDTMKYTEEYKWSGDGVIQQGELGEQYLLKEIIEYTIKVSDDVGYMMLLGYFGIERYNQFLADLGNLVTIGGSVKWGNTSAIDSLRNWKEIYSYLGSGSENATFFADLLKQTNKSYIRNALGNKFEVLNKMGWGVRNKCCHDHAIIMGEQPYVMIIMTMGDAGEKNQRFMEKLAVILNNIHEEMISQEVE